MRSVRSLVDATDEQVNAVNLQTPWLLSQAAGRKMVERGYGRIVLMGSLMTFQGGLNVPACASLGRRSWLIA